LMLANSPANCARINRKPFAPAAGFFTFAEKEILAQFDGLGPTEQRVTVGEMGADLGQFALGKIGIQVKHPISQHKLQHGVPEKLQSLIMATIPAATFVSNGWMGHRLAQEIGVFEFVADDLLKFLQWHGCRVAFAYRGMLPP
jgi:hypothetical protein